jgi:hypothetical protein
MFFVNYLHKYGLECVAVKPEIEPGACFFYRDLLRISALIARIRIGKLAFWRKKPNLRGNRQVISKLEIQRDKRCRQLNQ